MRFSPARIALFTLLLAILPSSVSAQDTEEARRAVQLAQEAQVAFEAGDIPTAIRSFEEAFMLRPDPAFAYNLGLLYEAEGELARAHRYLEAYLEIYEDAPNRGEVEEILMELRTELDRSWARIELSTEPGGGRLYLVSEAGDYFLGSSPVEFWFRPGEQTFSATLEEYYRQEHSMQLEAGSSTDLEMEMIAQRHRTRRQEQRCRALPADARCGG